MLLEAINSVLKQSQKSLEVLVFDDGSTDGTDELMKTVTDERVIYHRSEKNVGGGRRWGLKKARGKYITFLDHDDYYTDYDFFAKAIKIFEDHENDSGDPIVMVCANALRVDTRDHTSIPSDIGCPGRVKGIDFLLKPHEYHKPLSVFPTVFKAETLKQIDFEKYSTGDIHLYMLTAMIGDAWFMADTIGVYRIHGENESFGVKNNPEYDKRRYPARKKSMQTWNFIRDYLYGKAKKRIVDDWYIDRMTLITWFSALSSHGFNDRINFWITMLNASGFMPKLWVMLPLKLTVRFIRSQLRKITPLRRLYKKIKYGDSHHGEY